MSSTNPPSHTAKLDRILADAQRDREMGYRDKALKMYPHVCGRCAREFAGKRLSELTVHHRTLALHRPAVLRRRLYQQPDDCQGDA